MSNLMEVSHSFPCRIDHQEMYSTPKSSSKSPNIIGETLNYVNMGKTTPIELKSIRLFLHACLYSIGIENVPYPVR